jgi:hypothetical protein
MRGAVGVFLLIIHAPQMVAMCTSAEVSCLFMLLSYPYESALYHMQGITVKYRAFFFLSRYSVPQNRRHLYCIATQL